MESCLTATAPLSLINWSWVEALLRGGLAVAMLMEVEEDREVVVPWLVLPTMAPDTELDLGNDEIIAIIIRSCILNHK